MDAETTVAMFPIPSDVEESEASDERRTVENCSTFLKVKYYSCRPTRLIIPETMTDDFYSQRYGYVLCCVFDAVTKKRHLYTLVDMFIK